MLVVGLRGFGDLRVARLGWCFDEPWSSGLGFGGIRSLDLVAEVVGLG